MNQLKPMKNMESSCPHPTTLTTIIISEGSQSIKDDDDTIAPDADCGQFRLWISRRCIQSYLGKLI